jgi:hypothetical protein
MWDLFDPLRKKLEASAILERRPHLPVKRSVGQGNWANVPRLMPGIHAPPLGCA